MRRRVLQLIALTAGARGAAVAASTDNSHKFSSVTPEARLEFPRDHGAHSDFRIEWWYLTAWASTTAASIGDLGIQITFFRINTGWQREHRSNFAARELLFAHAALALPNRARLISAERSSRVALSLAEVGRGNTRLSLDQWSLSRDPNDRYSAEIRDARFRLSLTLQAEHAPVLQGNNGYSRKGPRVEQASYYYSRPRLALAGSLALDSTSTDRAQQGRWSTTSLRGQAWFDHEWSSELLDERAQGWDWVGLHLDDGSSLMAFRIRDQQGRQIWSDANWIDARQVRLLNTADVAALRFEPIRLWRSARSGATWPVAMRLFIAGRTLELQPLLDDQELDTRASTGVTYWEGAVTVFEFGRRIGRGYLELTGYAQALRI